MAAGVFLEGFACRGRELVEGGWDVCVERRMRGRRRSRRRRRSGNGLGGHDDGGDGVPLCKRGSQEIKDSGVASLGKQLAREFTGEESLRGGKTSVPVVCKEGHVCEDEVEALGLAVGKGANHEGHPVLEAGGGEGGDGGLGVDGGLDEVVLAAEV